MKYRLVTVDALQSKVAAAEHISRSGTRLLFYHLPHQSHNNFCNVKCLFMGNCGKGSAFPPFDQKGSLAGAVPLDVSPGLAGARLCGCRLPVLRLRVPRVTAAEVLGSPLPHSAKPAEPGGRAYSSTLPPPSAPAS